MKTLYYLLFSFLLFSSLLIAQDEYRGLVSADFRHRYDDYGYRLDSDLIGPRGMGMGGANLAASHDPTGIYFNPASLTSLSGLNVTISSKMNFDSQDHNHPDYSGIAVRTSISPTPTVDFATATYTIAMGKRNLTLGLGYRSFLDMSIKMESTQYYFGGLRISEKENNKGGMRAISPSFGFDILPGLSIGATYNKIFSNSNFELKLVSPFADNFLYFQFNDEEKYSGENIEMGMQWKPKNWVTLGAQYSPKWKCSIEEISEKFILLEGQTTRHTELITPNDELAKFNIDVPAEIGFGIAFNITRNTTLAADVRSQAWSDIVYSSSLNTINPIASKLTNSNSWHVGLEQIFPGIRWSFPIRLGAFSMPTPYQDRLFKGEYEGDQLENNGWSLGAGIHSSLLKIDFAFTRSSYTFGWWMTSSDYYNERIFETTERYNRFLLAFTLSL